MSLEQLGAHQRHDQISEEEDGRREAEDELEGHLSPLEPVGREDSGGSYGEEREPSGKESKIGEHDELRFKLPRSYASRA